MKLIAKRNFRIVPKLRKALGDDTIKTLAKQSGHEEQIAHGSVFELGEGNTFNDLDPDEKHLAAQLLHSSCVGDAKDPEVVERIKKEVEIERRREEAAAKRQKAAEEANASRAIAAVAAVEGQ